MNDSNRQPPVTEPPNDWSPVPIDPLNAQGPVRLCVAMRLKADPVEGWFFPLRDLPDARVYLGCVTDAASRALEWVELWFQQVDGLAESLAAYGQHLHNACLDRCWIQRFEVLRELSPEAVLETGGESKHPAPVWIDLHSRQAYHPALAGAEGGLELCQDEARLQAVGLPPFGTSLLRYLAQTTEAGTVFVPATRGGPEAPQTRTLASVVREESIPLNPEAGLAMVTEYYPLGLLDYLDLMGGKPWTGGPLAAKGLGPGSGRSARENGERAKRLDSSFLLASRGKAGRLLETFHLKLQALASVTELVEACVRKTQLPLLNLSADSFRVKLADTDGGLPRLWTPRCALMTPGQAQPLPIPSTTERYFVRIGQTPPSAYQPEGAGVPLHGAGTVRVRKVLPPEREGVVVEGTLVIAEPEPVSPRDLLWVRLPLGSARADLYGHAYAAEGLAKGEIRFRTLPQRHSETVLAALKAAEGIPVSRASFEIVPLLSSPCDLYALGVLAVRALLVDERTTLAVALDEALSLARQLSLEHRPEAPLPARIRDQFAKDPRWQQSLGPHRIAEGDLDPAVAAGLVPSSLWMEALANLIRLFPGMGPDSLCRDLGDAPSLALETVFASPLESWRALASRTRGMLLGDWAGNRAIQQAIQVFRRA